MKNKRMIRTSVIIVTLFTLICFVFLFNYNSQLKINIFSELKMYQFKMGTGFIEYKPSASQKKAIWNLIKHMSPTKEIKLKKEAKAGGYYAFSFKGKNLNKDFFLIDLGKDKLYISVAQYDKKGNVVNTDYFLSSTHLVKRIDDVILNYD